MLWRAFNTVRLAAGDMDSMLLRPSAVIMRVTNGCMQMHVGRGAALPVSSIMNLFKSAMKLSRQSHAHLKADWTLDLQVSHFRLACCALMPLIGLDTHDHGIAVQACSSVCFGFLYPVTAVGCLQACWA